MNIIDQVCVLRSGYSFINGELEKSTKKLNFRIPKICQITNYFSNVFSLFMKTAGKHI